MTLGELDDKIKELREAQQAVIDAEISIGYGGNADTINRKKDWLSFCKSEYSRLRYEEVKL